MKVAVLMGSKSDLPVLEECTAVLRQFGIPFEMRILSAHRTPDEVAEFARSARENGFSVVIAGAGMSAHLAGVIAAHAGAVTALLSGLNETLAWLELVPTTKV